MFLIASYNVTCSVCFTIGHSSYTSWVFSPNPFIRNERMLQVKIFKIFFFRKINLVVIVNGTIPINKHIIIRSIFISVHVDIQFRGLRQVKNYDTKIIRKKKMCIFY